MNGTSTFDDHRYELLATMVQAGIYNAARGISGMIGEELSISEPEVRRVSLSEISNLLGGPETETVGIYLRVDGTMAGQMMLIMPYEKALELADQIMGQPHGTTHALGCLERSALAELGNVTGTFFLNSIALTTRGNTRPSPPAVLVDMIGAILDVILTTTDSFSDSVFMIRANFLRSSRDTQAELWVIPDRSTLDVLANREMS